MTKVLLRYRVQSRALFKDLFISAIGQLIDVDLEILVGDDNSSDGTQAIVEGIARTFPGVIRYFSMSRISAPPPTISILSPGRKATSLPISTVTTTAFRGSSLRS